MAGRMLSSQELEVDEPNEQWLIEMGEANLVQEEDDQMQSNTLGLVEPWSLPKSCKGSHLHQVKSNKLNRHPQKNEETPSWKS